MGALAAALRGHALVGVDTNCFIYYLEGGPWAEELRQDFFLPLEQGRFRAVTSVLTLAEILVRPKSVGRDEVCEEYKALLCSYPHLEVVPFTIETAVLCAEIRARHRVRTPDAIQLAVALQTGATLFLTNDTGLPKRVGQLTVAVLKEILSQGRR